MVVSGLPVPNGDRHTGEIASVALELLHQCGKFKIRHLYDVPLLLRIGIHTGSCAAGELITVYTPRGRMKETKSLSQVAQIFVIIDCRHAPLGEKTG